MSYEATPKQRSYFHSLTGQWPPRGASKSQVSRLIDKALKGEITKPKDVIRVYGWRFTGIAARCMTEEMQQVKYAVDRNYQVVRSNFATLEEAEAFARSRFPEDEIEVSRSIREQYVD